MCRLLFTLRIPLISALLCLALQAALVLAPAAPTSAAERRGLSAGKLLAAKRLTPAQGGTVRAPNGVTIQVAPGVLTRPGFVTISRIAPSVYDLHIEPRWEGRVTIRLPLNGKRAVVGHLVDGAWVFEKARRVRGMAVTRVDSLSAFTDLLACTKELVKRGTASGKAIKVVRCLGRVGLKKLPEWIAKKIAGLFSEYDPCRPIGWDNWSPEAWDYFLQACTASAPAPLPSPEPAPVATESGNAEAGTGTVPVPTAAPPPTAPPSPPPSEPVAIVGFTISDVYFGGTWARTDPNNGTWYSRTNPPPNGAYWYPNGLGVAVDCARTAAPYTVYWADGRVETWTTWFHVTDGKWFPAAAAAETTSDAFYGLRLC